MTYKILSTDNSVTIDIPTGTINGDVPGAIGADSDLVLFGRGSFDWGEGVEQNIFRNMENWAVHARDDSVPVNSQVPEPFFGQTNRGIKNPVIGQTWYNRSNQRLYVFIGPVGNGQVAGSWRTDGENRYLALQGGGTVDGDIIVQRPAGVDASITIETLGATDDMILRFTDNIGERAKLFVDQNSTNNVDVLKIQKLNGGNVVTGLDFTDDYIQIVNGTGNGKMLSETPDANDPGTTLVTKDYVAAIAGFVGGIVTGDANNFTFTGENPTLSTIRVQSQGTNDSRFVVADNNGDDRGSFHYDQSSEVLSIRNYDASGVVSQQLAFFDTYIQTVGGGKIRTPSTDLINDHPDTLITLNSAKDFFQPANEKLVIEPAAQSPQTPFIELRGQQRVELRLTATDITPQLTTETVVEFAGLNSANAIEAIGDIRAFENRTVPNPISRISMRKLDGTDIENEMRMEDGITSFIRPVELIEAAIPAVAAQIPSDNRLTTNAQLIAASSRPITSFVDDAQVMLRADGQADRNAWVPAPAANPTRISQANLPSLPTNTAPLVNRAESYRYNVGGLGLNKFTTIGSAEIIVDVNLGFVISLDDTLTPDPYRTVPIIIEFWNFDDNTFISGPQSTRQIGTIGVNGVGETIGQFSGSFTIPIDPSDSMSTLWRWSKNSFGGGEDGGATFQWAWLGQIHHQWRIV